MLRLLLGIIVALSLLAGQAFAAWVPDGVPVCTYPPCQEANQVIAPDGAGGVFVVWQDGRSVAATGYDDIYAQHLTATGEVAPGWPAGGLPICTDPASQGGPAVLADGEGGVFACWTDFRNNAVSQGDVYAQHVRGDGTLAPGWAVNGMPVTQEPDLDNTIGEGALALDGSGGLFVIWWGRTDIVWVQHLNASGAPAAGWPSDGLVACTFLSDPRSIIADGAGGAVLAWTDARRGGFPNGDDAYGLRLTASGAIAPGWATNGNLLALGQWKPILLPDGTDGFFLATASPSLQGFGFDAHYYLHRFTMDGVPAPGWPAGGVVVCSAPGDRAALMVVPDGFGGVLLDWYDYRLPGDDVYASRVLPSGVLAPGWPGNGLRVSDPAHGNEFNFGLAADGSGGAYLSWEDDTFIAISIVQHVAAHGAVAPGWPQYGLRVASTSAQFTPQLVPDNAAGAIVVWEERGGVGSRLGLFAQRFAAGGPTPALLALVGVEVKDGRVRLDWFAADAAGLRASVERRTETSAWRVLDTATSDGSGHLRYEDGTVSPGMRYAYRLGYVENGLQQFSAETWVEVPALKLALEGLRPNPAVGDLNASFALPSAEPAWLQLLDITGRVWLAREVGSLGAGNHLIHLGRGSQVPAGLYWLRLTQSGRSLIARGVLVR